MENQNYTKSVKHAKKEPETNTQDTAGILDGITLFRFAHIWMNNSSGGVEAYLNNLNRNLLQRNRMRILQMYLETADTPLKLEIEPIGRGELVWIPSVLKSNHEQHPNIIQKVWAKVRRFKSNQLNICHDFLVSILNSYRINLGVFHWISEDSPIILDFLNKVQVPFVVVNHFQNSRLKIPCIRRQILDARAVGGVSNVGVPGFVRNRFTNLSDGVDTDFFCIEKAEPLEKKIAQPVILLPARITLEKGHLDAIKALKLLSHWGLNAELVFVGRYQENPVFMNQLQQVISEERLQERVSFTGEICPVTLRNWYAAASVVILPSYSEGLGKVLLEAQAMERPVVAYEVGGISSALNHGVGGFLVKKGNIEGFASILKELLKNDNMRRTVGTNGRNFIVERFTLDALTTRHENFYAKYLK